MSDLPATGLFMGQSNDTGAGVPELLLWQRANRHGVIAGATGTGKTVTLQILAQGFSDAGVPVFCADVKGDLSGISQPGSPNEKLIARAAGMGLTLNPKAAPTVFWDLYGKKGHPVRATVSEIGPLLMARMMDLNDVQEGVLTVAFHVADKEGLLLLDLDDLRSMLTYVAENAARIGREVGNVAPASIASIQRALLQLEPGRRRRLLRRAGPAPDGHDAHRSGRAGSGQCAGFDAADEQPAPVRGLPAVAAVGAVRATARGRRPGQAQAGLLLRRGSSAVQGRAQAAAGEGRAGGAADPLQGGGHLFHHPEPGRYSRQRPGRNWATGCSTRSAPIPPSDQRGLKAASESFRVNPAFDTAEAIQALGTGEALVSVLDEKGAPTITARTLIRPPDSRLGPATDAERASVMAGSPVAGVYDAAIDRESAEEVLAARHAAADQAADAEVQAKADAKAQAQADKAAARPTPRAAPAPRAPAAPRRSTRETPIEAMTKSVLRTAGSTITRELLRGLLGGLKRR
jgi:DNA helicase HerA-like ATPase